MNASTHSGSNWSPLQEESSSIASGFVRDGLYARSEIIASKLSATDRMRAASGISSPFSRSGYPSPSYLSW